ncbi:MAG: DUF2807 domain-containing protein [Bacteroidota bacterium]
MKTHSLLMKAGILSIITISTHLSIAQTFTIQPISRIKTLGTAKLTYYYHDKPFTEITADSSNIKVTNNTLIVKNVSAIIKSNNTKIHEIILDGASSVKVFCTIDNDNLLVEADGASDIETSVKSRRIICKSRGSSDIILNGNTDTLITKADGSSSQKLKNLVANVVILDADGASDISVFPQQSINGHIDGVSDVKLFGQPSTVNIEKLNSTASLKRKNFNDSSASKNKSKSWRFKWSESDRNKSWQGIAFGINGYLSSQNDIQLPTNENYLALNYSQSFNFQWNFTQHNIYLYKKNIALVTGLGIEWKRFAFDNNVHLNPDSSFTYGVIDSTKTFVYKRNLLKASYVQIPLLLEFHIGKKNKLNIDAGIIGEWKLTSRTRQILEKDNYRHDIVRKDSYNLNPFLFKYHFSIGINTLSLYAEYTFTPLFQNNKGATLYPFNIGLLWNLYD